MKNIFLTWSVGLNFGYGLLGYNIFAQWACDPEVVPLMGTQISPANLAGVDAFKLLRLLPAIHRSNAYLAQSRQLIDGVEHFDATVIHAHNRLFSRGVAWGECNIARCVFENTEIGHAQIMLESYDHLLVASKWNADLLHAATGRPVTVIHEGIDPSLFCPGPRSGILDAKKFYVFSSGKVEFRKAQDLTLLAFSIFAQRHSDAVLVTAWHSPWPDRSVGFQGKLKVALQAKEDGSLDIMQWIVANGIPAEQAIDLGSVNNLSMPSILREVDIALQPARAEACTSLPVKEAMACGVPVIFGANTGMLDLVGVGHCLPLEQQGPVAPFDGVVTQGWGESDVEEILEALEWAYQHRDAARALGLRGCQWLIEQRRTWQDHARALKQYVLTR